MPRQSRIDLAGQLYHVMSRGMERGRIFYDDSDYADFTVRLGRWLKDSGAKCLAWCLMPNHFHLLVLRGEMPLSGIMHHVMTGYAVKFNHRHKRAGHLFQNRYKAIICDKDEYLSALVPYIHLNPLRAKLVSGLPGLEYYRWCGHGSAAGGKSDGILDREALMFYFGGEETAAKGKYITLMEERAGQRDHADLSGGGLLRSLGGVHKAVRVFMSGEKVIGDQRILGNSDFVEAVISASGEAVLSRGMGRAEILSYACNCCDVTADEALRPSHRHSAARARAIYCYLCRENSCALGRELMLELGVTQSGISRLVWKGRKLAEEMKLVI